MKEEPIGQKSLLSLLWIFVSINYVFCDVVTGMDSAALNGYLAGQIGNLHFSQGFLLGASLFMEIPFAMILVARLAPYSINRGANVLAALFMTAIQIASLFAGTPPQLHYLFFSGVEVITTVAIVTIALRWIAPNEKEER